MYTDITHSLLGMNATSVSKSSDVRKDIGGHLVVVCGTTHVQHAQRPSLIAMSVSKRKVIEGGLTWKALHQKDHQHHQCVKSGVCNDHAITLGVANPTCIGYNRCHLVYDQSKQPVERMHHPTLPKQKEKL